MPGSPSTGTFRDGCRAPERKHLSVWELCWGGALLLGSGRRAQGTDITP
jgi:hypothetical protein